MPCYFSSNNHVSEVHKVALDHNIKASLGFLIFNIPCCSHKLLYVQHLCLHAGPARFLDISELREHSLTISFATHSNIASVQQEQSTCCSFRKSLKSNFSSFLFLFFFALVWTDMEEEKGYFTIYIKWHPGAWSMSLPFTEDNKIVSGVWSLCTCSCQLFVS